MIRASLYITLCSARNRIRVRLRRLREPRYLIGAIAGAAYFYFSIFARLGSRSRMPRRRGAPPANVPLEALLASGPTLAGIALLVLMAIAWLLPTSSGLLDFTDAETQFLFPAPVSRRQLLVHRLMRSQLGLLFAAIVPALLFPSGSPGSRAAFAVSMWVILFTVKVHFTGITLARASLTLGGTGKLRRWGSLAVMLGAIIIVGDAVARAFASPPVAGLRDVLERLDTVAATGLPRLILWPFMALARPLFSVWPGPYLEALAAAVAVLTLNVVWVLRSDEAFQEAVARVEALRAARRSRQMPAPRARATRWVLAPSGRPEAIFAWKNAMQMLRETSIATIVRYGVPFMGVLLLTGSLFLRQNRGVAALFGALAAGAAVFMALLGPQMARSDLRQDLLHLDLLKTWPIRASAVIRGEMLWPATMVTLVVWGAIAAAAVLWTSEFSPATLAWRVSIALAAAIVAPALVLAQFTIHNAAAVWFPAWVPLGASRPRGVDAMGQRLILFAGVLFGLTLMLAPGVMAAGLLSFVLWRVTGPPVLVPAAAVCAVIVLLEVLLATEALGPVYERLDVSAIERGD